MGCKPPQCQTAGQCAVRRHSCSCDYTCKMPGAQKTINWRLGMSQAEMNQAVALNTNVVFKWNGYHNVWQLPDQTAFDRCDFSNGKELGPATKNTYTYKASAVGKVFFACEVGGGSHCNAKQKLALTVADRMECNKGSAKNCVVKAVNVKGYSAGKLVRVDNGLKVSKSTQKNSCPAGYKIWSPRSKQDWTSVYNAMGKNTKKYPQKPNLIIDVTSNKKGCGGCAKFAMKSGVKQQNMWKTSDGSKWWLRDTKYNEPNGDYHANCYLHVSNANPNDVRFNDQDCKIMSTAYLCQPKAKTPPKPPAMKCNKGSAKNCVVKAVNVKGYSAGKLVRVQNGLKVSKSTQKNSCPAGYKIWSPRSKQDWTKVYDAMGKTISKYPRKPYLLVDVTSKKDGCGGCNEYAMKFGVKQQKMWKTIDGSKWWLRDTKYNEPNGDYKANCYLHVSNVNPNDVRFNDANCKPVSSEYLCQPKLKKKL